MSERIFPVVKIDRDTNFTGLDWPRSRERAFLRAAQERCLFASDWPEELPESLNALRRCHRVPSSYTGESHRLNELDHWEDVLASPYNSEILTQGDAVRNALKPAMIGNQILYIVDPYLFSFGNDDRTYSDGLEHLLTFSPVIFQGIMVLPENVMLSNIEKISIWLERVNPAVTATTIYFAPPKTIHDRFLAFCSKIEDQNWLSVSVGYGLHALTGRQNKPTCLARISSQQFDGVWKLSKDLCQTCIVKDSSNASLGGEWLEDRRIIRPGGEVKVYKRRSARTASRAPFSNRRPSNHGGFRR